MKTNTTNKKIRVQMEYLNALGMPVVVTKKVTPDKLQEMLEMNSSNANGRNMLSQKTF